MPTVAQRFARHHAGGGSRSRQQAGPVVLMVSGGADSTALLVMACTSQLDLDDGRGAARIARERLHVLHVNHHLRDAASDADEAFVRELCARYGVPLCVEHASFTDLGGQNLEAAPARCAMPPPAATCGNSVRRRAARARRRAS